MELCNLDHWNLNLQTVGAFFLPNNGPSTRVHAAGGQRTSLELGGPLELVTFRINSQMKLQAGSLIYNRS